MRSGSALVLLGACIALTFVAACPRPLPPGAAGGLPGCGKDTDCKGARVCDRGQCIEPPATGHADGGADGSSPPGDGGAPDAGPPPITLPGAAPGFHGGWSHHGRSRYRVSVRAPREIGRLAAGGTIYSSPAITDDGVAIFGAHDRRIRGAALAAGEGGEALVARWTVTTGDLVWCSPALGPGPAASPAPAGDAGAAAPPPVTAYVGSDDDRLLAIDAASGAVRWTFTAGPCKRAVGPGPEAARCDVDAVTVGPDGTIYLVADGAYALHPDGGLRWRFPLRTHCAAAPAVGLDGSVYFGCQDGRLYAVGPDGGKRWEVRTGDDVDSAPAVGADGTVYFGSDDGRLYAVTPAGVVRWTLKTGDDVRAAPAIAEDGTIYVGSFDGNLYAVRPDGTVAWAFAAADRILGSPTIDAAGVILFGSQDDRLYALGPDGRMLWSVLLGGDVDSTPAIGPDGTIYVGADDKLFHALR